MTPEIDGAGGNAGAIVGFCGFSQAQRSVFPASVR